MHLRVKLFATLARYAPVDGLAGTPFDVEVPEPFNLAQLVTVLKLPEEEVKIAFVNGIIQTPDFLLSNDDDIGIFPPIGGG